MADYFVRALTGSDTNNGLSWATAVRTVERAWNISVADVNTRIIIGPGIYRLTGIMNARGWSTGAVTRIVHFIGTGGVIWELGSTSAFLPMEPLWAHIFQGIHFFNRNMLELRRRDSTTMEVVFLNCGLPAELIRINVISTAASSNSIFARSCNLNLATTTPLSNANFTNTHDIFYAVGTVGIWSWDFVNCLLNCSPGTSGFYQPIVPNLTPRMGAVPVTPHSIQFDAGGPAFIEAPFGVYARFNVTAVGRGADFTATNSFTQHQFLGWRVAAGEVGEFETSADSISPRSGEPLSIISPVYFYLLGFSISHLGFKLEEFNSLNEHFSIDSSPLTKNKTVELRVSDDVFTQLALLPNWVELDWESPLLSPVVGRFIQYKITFAHYVKE